MLKTNFNISFHFRDLIQEALMIAVLTSAPIAVHAGSKTAMGDTGCTWYEDVSGAVQDSSLTGAQCPFTSTLDGSIASGTTIVNPPIPLITSTGLLSELNAWLAENNKGVSIQPDSLVAIEAIGGPGRDGNSCGDCTSGKGAGAGYAVSVQNLGGMLQLISKNPRTITPIPALFIYVGSEGKKADTDKGGGGGAGSIVIGGQNLGNIPQNYVLFPSAETNASLNSQKIDNMIFAMGGGGGAGGGARDSSKQGHHGGEGGRMNEGGPNTTQDVTAPGENGSGGKSEGIGGSQDSDGSGGDRGGISGIGGMGGLGAGFVGVSTGWPYGQGGPIGGGQGIGGAGGGGWGGGGGGTQNNEDGGGGAGGGSWARKSVSQGGTLPTLYNINGAGFSISDAGQSQVVITFEAISTIGCSSDCLTVGGTVNGLNDNGLVLQNNAGDFLTISDNGAFTFPTGLSDGRNYAVTIFQQPENQTCSVSNGSGVLIGNNVIDVMVSCADNSSIEPHSVFQPLTGIYQMEGVGYLSIHEKTNGQVVAVFLKNLEGQSTLESFALKTWGALYGIRNSGDFQVYLKSVLEDGAYIEVNVVQISPGLIEVDNLVCNPWSEETSSVCAFPFGTRQTYIKVF